MQNKNMFLERLITEISASPELKKQFIREPKSFIQPRLNFKIPDNFQIAVHEDTPTLLNIVIPNQSDELSEIELAEVSGGICWSDVPDDCYIYGHSSDIKLKINIKDL